MSDEKDRLGDKLRDVEAAREDQWAKKRDVELLEKMREKVAASMLCPKCKSPLVAKTENGVEMFACSRGDGAWLDDTTLKALVKSMK
jgi:RNase P subunit RPR2